jgi:hypothetical protein
MTESDKRKLRRYLKNKENSGIIFYSDKERMELRKMLWLVFCWFGGLYLGFFWAVAVQSILPFIFVFILTYLMAQYHVVLDALKNPGEMVKEIKIFSILFIIEIVLLIFIL